MNDVFDVQIRQPVKDLGSERLDNLLVEHAMFSQVTLDGPATDVFQESAQVK